MALSRICRVCMSFFSGMSHLCCFLYPLAGWLVFLCLSCLYLSLVGYLSDPSGFLDGCLSNSSGFLDGRFSCPPCLSFAACALTISG